MDKFNIKDSWLVIINEKILKQNEKLNAKDAKFFNLSILTDLARLTQRFSHKCNICENNKLVVEELATTTVDKIETIKGRREVTQKLDVISKHLRNQHKMFIRGYFLSIFAILGLILGLGIGFAVGYYFKTYRFFILVGLAAGLLIGWFLGKYKEKKLFDNNQLYGKL